MPPIRSKEEYRKEGVPVGVGAPEDPDLTKVARPLSEPEQMRVAMQAAMEETPQQDEIIEAGMMQEAVMGKNYRPQMPYGEKTKILDFINTTKPYQREWVTNPKTGEGFVQVSGGDIEFEVMEMFSGFLAHNASMSNLGEKELRVANCTLDIAEMAARMARPRSAYTPELNAAIVNAKHLASLKLNMNKDGQERQLAATEITKEMKTIGVTKEPSRYQNIMDRIKGKDG